MLTKQKTSERKGPNVNKTKKLLNVKVPMLTKQKTSERKGPNVNNPPPKKKRWHQKSNKREIYSINNKCFIL